MEYYVVLCVAFTANPAPAKGKVMTEVLASLAQSLYPEKHGRLQQCGQVFCDSEKNTESRGIHDPRIESVGYIPHLPTDEHMR